MPRNPPEFNTDTEAQSMKEIKQGLVEIRVHIPRELYDRLALFGADPLREGKLRRGFIKRVVIDALENWYHAYITSEDGVEDLRARISKLREDYRHELRNPFAK